MFKDVRIERNNARGKRIERFIGKWRMGIEKEREGWIARPTALSEANQQDLTVKPKIIPYDNIVKAYQQDIVTLNNMEHPRQKGISCWDYFLQNQNPDLKPINYKAILPYLGIKEESSVNVGLVRFRYSEWVLSDDGISIALGNQLIALLRKIEGADIDIYWLDGNNGDTLKALVYLNDRYICELMPKPEYNRASNERTAVDDDARSLMSAYKASILNFQKSQKQSIERVTVIDNRPKTIGTSFKIAGMSKPIITEDIENREVEILESIPENNYELITDETQFKRTLKDSF